MTVTNMSKARPQIDFSLHKAPYKDLYDITIFFSDGTNQFWSGINEKKVMWLCEKYNPISTPLSIAIAPRFLPKSNIQKPNWEIRKGQKMDRNKYLKIAIYFDIFLAIFGLTYLLMKFFGG